jgi:negative regulator of replication initiation
MPTTTIQIDIEVRDQLRARGRMGESYNDVLRRLLTATRSADANRPLPPNVAPTSLPKPLFVHRDRE